MRRPGIRPKRFLTASERSVSSWSLENLQTLIRAYPPLRASVSVMPRKTRASGTSRFHSAVVQAERGRPGSLQDVGHAGDSQEMLVAPGVSARIEGQSPITHLAPDAAARPTTASTTAGCV